jgi:hypothetical protein
MRWLELGWRAGLCRGEGNTIDLHILHICATRAAVEAEAVFVPNL